MLIEVTWNIWKHFISDLYFGFIVNEGFPFDLMEDFNLMS